MKLLIVAGALFVSAHAVLLGAIFATYMIGAWWYTDRYRSRKRRRKDK